MDCVDCGGDREYDNGSCAVFVGYVWLGKRFDDWVVEDYGWNGEGIWSEIGLMMMNSLRRWIYCKDSKNFCGIV